MQVSRVPSIRERRLALFRELAKALAQSQSDLLAWHLEDFERRTVWQRQLCEDLRTLPAGVEQGRRQSPVAADSYLPQRGTAEEQEMVEAQMQVCQQARVYAASLRRVRRTVDIFCRVLANSGVTYAAPLSNR